MRRLLLVALSTMALALTSCTPSAIPMSSSINDGIMMNIKTSPTTVAYAFETNVPDGTLIPCKKDSREPVGSTHPGYNHTESATLGKMLNDYVAMRFKEVDGKSDTKLKVTLSDFWVEQYTTDSDGKLWLVALGGGEINYTIVANVAVTYELTRPGAEPVIKKIKVSGDSSSVQGIGTGTSTSSFHRGTESIEHKVAAAVNAANNKAVAMLNNFIENN